MNTVFIYSAQIKIAYFDVGMKKLHRRMEHEKGILDSQSHTVMDCL